MAHIIQLKIESAREAQRLLKFYAIEENRINSEISTLEVDRDRVRENIKDIKRKIEQINSAPHLLNEIETYQLKQHMIISSSLNKENFEPAWTITNKAVFILKQLKSLCTVNEIVDHLKNYDTSSSISDRQLKANYSSTLGVKAKKNTVFSRILDKESNDYLYGLSHWFLPNGDVKDEYRQNEKTHILMKDKEDVS